MNAMKLLLLFLSIILAVVFFLYYLKKQEVYYIERSPDRNYTVQINALVPKFRTSYNVNYCDALIQVKDKEGNILKEWRAGPATMCHIIWGNKDVSVGGESYEFPVAVGTRVTPSPPH